MASWDLIQQGRGWLQEGEGPNAVAEEALQLVEEAGGNTVVKGAWLLVAGEAQLASGSVKEAVANVTEAFTLLRKGNQRQSEAAALSTLVNVHLARQEWGDALSAAKAAAEVYRGLGDTSGEAAMLLKQAVVQVRQMKDPFVAAQTAQKAAERFNDRADQSGRAEALQVAAEAHLLYAPEEALKAANDALSAWDATGNAARRVEAAELVAAAKVQLATTQRATVATSQSARGDEFATFKYPKYEQQRGERAYDPFAKYGPEEELSLEEQKRLPKRSNDENSGNKLFMGRKDFGWRTPYGPTDDAWFRQELRHLPA